MIPPIGHALPILANRLVAELVFRPCRELRRRLSILDVSQRSPALKRVKDNSVSRRSPAETGVTARAAGLTNREIDVIELAVQGLTNGQIAERLSLSTYAIKFHLSSTYGKLGVANRTQAAVAYLNLRTEGQG